MVKLERTNLPPPSLAEEKKKVSGVYNKPDVVDTLCSDSFGKCYLCNIKPVQDPEVEHLRPHKGDVDLKFQWENLFYSCGHCNSAKNNSAYENIINCCEIDPESVLLFLVEDVSNIAVISKTQEKEHLATANLLTDIFNKTNTGLRTKKTEVRVNALLEQMELLFETLEEFQKDPENPTNERLLKLHLRRSSPFAAFKRCYVLGLENSFVAFEELKTYLSTP